MTPERRTLEQMALDARVMVAGKMTALDFVKRMLAWLVNMEIDSHLTELVEKGVDIRLSGYAALEVARDLLDDHYAGKLDRTDVISALNEIIPQKGV